MNMNQGLTLSCEMKVQTLYLFLFLFFKLKLYYVGFLFGNLSRDTIVCASSVVVFIIHIRGSANESLSQV